MWLLESRISSTFFANAADLILSKACKYTNVPHACTFSISAFKVMTQEDPTDISMSAVDDAITQEQIIERCSLFPAKEKGLGCNTAPGCRHADSLTHLFDITTSIIVIYSEFTQQQQQQHYNAVKIKQRFNFF
mmetsp:Transcript_10571/g.20899  ORF Transcript_10571/g.20899 Transcript_10571/m.20899 type:complete len:133 (-) Transcript_10571:6-404(-)